MQSWHTPYLGLNELPRDISTFELQTFFTYRGAERELIEARRGNALKLGLALHIGFLRLSGRLLKSVQVVPYALWRHLGQELGVAAPELASLKALYGRGRTLFDHQQLACEVLGFRWMTEHQRRALVRTLRDEVARCADRDQLLVFARRWLYQSKILIPRDRDMRVLVTAALAQLEEETAKAIAATVPVELLSRWRSAMSALRPDGQALNQTNCRGVRANRVFLCPQRTPAFGDAAQSGRTAIRAAAGFTSSLGGCQNQSTGSNSGGRLFSALLPVHSY